MAKHLEANCEIVIATTLSEAWSAWFDEFDVTAEGPTSRMVGTVVDQAALHGVLAKLRDLDIPILDVHIAPGSIVGSSR